MWLHVLEVGAPVLAVILTALALKGPTNETGNPPKVSACTGVRPRDHAQTSEVKT